MELKEFIMETIEQVTHGLHESHILMREKNLGKIDTQTIKLKFDINVILSENTNTKRGAGITVANVLNIKGDKVKAQSNSNSNRICFEVKILSDTMSLMNTVPVI